jgi:hypothetical protein
MQLTGRMSPFIHSFIHSFRSHPNAQATVQSNLSVDDNPTAPAPQPQPHIRPAG